MLPLEGLDTGLGNFDRMREAPGVADIDSPGLRRTEYGSAVAGLGTSTRRAAFIGRTGFELSPPETDGAGTFSGEKVDKADPGRDGSLRCLEIAAFWAAITSFSEGLDDNAVVDLENDICGRPVGATLPSFGESGFDG